MYNPVRLFWSLDTLILTTIVRVPFLAKLRWYTMQSLDGDTKHCAVWNYIHLGHLQVIM